MKYTHAKELPWYKRAIKRYPHLAYLASAKQFCFQLCILAAVDTIPAADYMEIARIASEKEEAHHETL